MTQTDRVALAMESLQIDFTNGNPVEENFEGLMTAVYLSTNADCYIAFDTSANTDDFILGSGDGVVAFEKAQFTRLSVKGVNGSGTLYVIACRV